MKTPMLVNTIFSAFLLLSMHALTFEDNSEESSFTCFTSPKISSVSLGIGYLSAKSKIYCEDGSQANLKISGLQVLNAGISFTDEGESEIVFENVHSISDIEGVYHGAGGQFSVTAIVSGDFAIFTNGNVTMKWLVPADGIEVGLHYRALSVDIDDVTPPSDHYQAIKNILGSLDISFVQASDEIRTYPWLDLKVVPASHIELPLQGLLSNRLYMSVVREGTFFDEEIWSTLGIPVSTVPLGDLFAGREKDKLPNEYLYQGRPYPYVPLIIERGYLSGHQGMYVEPGESYVLTVTSPGRNPKIRFKYKFTFPAKEVAGAKIPAEIEWSWAK